MSTAGPVKPPSRFEFVDILPGFALIGVLTANLTSFSGYSTNPDSVMGSVTDQETEVVPMQESDGLPPVEPQGDSSQESDLPPAE